MEWSIIDRTFLPEDRVALRWGGVGIHLGNPEHGAWLLPGQVYKYGSTRLTTVRGDVQQGFYAFRAEMEGRGHVCPSDFDPPVHWNQLYDNKFLLSGENLEDPEIRRKYYPLDDLKAEAKKAVEFSCEALYLDPGWDTQTASKIWDEARLGPFRDFTDALARDFGLKCSLHAPLSGWCNPSTYPVDSYRVDRFGTRTSWMPLRGPGKKPSTAVPPICGASEQFIQVTIERLKELARDGAAFFMFDGTTYHAECWDDEHGHPVPARREEHIAATFRLAREIHTHFPDVLIEMHDALLGGVFTRYVPLYYGHGNSTNAAQARGFDSIWAFELMWEPLTDLLNGNSLVLYYYNLSYSIPLYIHIDLRDDNANALAFWWSASTCRHLGIGGTHKDPAVVAAQKDAMKTYRRLKRYFTIGIFYGIDEMTHVHSCRDGRAAVINCFNLSSATVEREIMLDPSQLSLDAKRHYRFSGAEFARTHGKYVGSVRIPPFGHTLIEVT